MAKAAKKRKNPGGRPKLPTGEAKTRLLDVRFNAKELAALKSIAADAKMPWSVWVRWRLGLA